MDLGKIDNIGFNDSVFFNPPFGFILCRYVSIRFDCTMSYPLFHEIVPLEKEIISFMLSFL